MLKKLIENILIKTYIQKFRNLKWMNRQVLLYGNEIKKTTVYSTAEFYNAFYDLKIIVIEEIYSLFNRGD